MPFLLISFNETLPLISFTRSKAILNDDFFMNKNKKGDISYCSFLV